MHLLGELRCRERAAVKSSDEVPLQLAVALAAALGALPAGTPVSEVARRRSTRWLSALLVEPRRFGADREALRRALLARGATALDAALARIGPWSIGALLATLVLLFAFQGQAILNQPLVIALLAVPILIQVFFNAGLAYWLNREVGEKHSVACPSALIGASNFFELAVAAAISLFGFHSGAALATVVGVLIEVPVMLLVVHIVNRSKGWYERAA